MANYLLTEDGGRLLLEDGGGLLLETQPTYRFRYGKARSGGGGSIDRSAASVTITRTATGRR